MNSATIATIAALIVSNTATYFISKNIEAKRQVHEIGELIDRFDRAQEEINDLITAKTEQKKELANMEDRLIEAIEKVEQLSREKQETETELTKKFEELSEVESMTEESSTTMNESYEEDSISEEKPKTRKKKVND